MSSTTVRSDSRTLISRAPHPSEPDLPAGEPIRAGGIMPAPTLDPGARARPAE